jgi:hypothetical protein
MDAAVDFTHFSRRDHGLPSCRLSDFTQWTLWILRCPGNLPLSAAQQLKREGTKEDPAEPTVSSVAEPSIP